MTMIKLSIICPICSSEKVLPYPISPIINGKENLTSVFVEKGLIYDHQFQFFIDKDFKIQNYQIVDLDLIG
jgi:hypothetical protein